MHVAPTAHIVLLLCLSPDIGNSCQSDGLLVVPAPVTLSKVKGPSYPPETSGTVHPGEQYRQ